MKRWKVGLCVSVCVVPIYRALEDRFDSACVCVCLILTYGAQGVGLNECVCMYVCLLLS